IVERCLREIAVISNNVKFRITNLLSNEFKLSYPNALNTFKASDPWLNLFINWFDFSLRRHTKTSQKLSKDLSKKLAEFYSFINELRINNNFELNYIANMDEISVLFNIVGAYTLDNYKVLADGSKLLLMVIFKGKKVPKGQNKRSLLVFDSFKEYLTTIVKNKCYDMNTVLGIIPEHKFTKKENIKKPDISNALDNSENYLIESNQTKEEEECVINLVDKNKENKESITTTSIPYTNTKRSYLIGEDKTEIMNVLLY
ncbi:14683_t:CDS:2, partial [Gigaspora margarita]